MNTCLSAGIIPASMNKNGWFLRLAMLHIKQSATEKLQWPISMGIYTYFILIRFTLSLMIKGFDNIISAAKLQLLFE